MKHSICTPTMNWHSAQSSPFSSQEQKDLLFARQKWSITCIYSGPAFITRRIELNRVEMNSRNLSHHVRPFYVPQIYLFTLSMGEGRDAREHAG